MSKCKTCKYWKENGYDDLAEKRTGMCPMLSKGVSICDENNIPAEIVATYHSFGCIFHKDK